MGCCTLLSWDGKQNALSKRKFPLYFKLTKFNPKTFIFILQLAQIIS